MTDGEPPHCTIKFAGARAKTSGPNTYFGRGLRCVFSADDRHSGVDNVYVSINGATFRPATQLALETEMNYDLRFYAVDKVGNIGKLTQKFFSVDLSPPVTVAVQHMNLPEGGPVLYSRANSLALSAKDSLSQVEATYYRFDDDQRFSQYRAPIPLSSLGDGNHMLTYYSVAVLGNEEVPRTFSFSMDNEPPVPTVVFDGHMFEGIGGGDSCHHAPWCS